MVLKTLDYGSLKFTIAVDKIQQNAFEFEFEALANTIKKEFESLEASLEIILSQTELPENVLELGVQEGLTKALYAAHNGVYRMSPDIEDLVETSNNIARVLVKEGAIKIGCLTRSSVESSKVDLANALRATFELIGCEVELSGDYPGWAPNMKSPILSVLVDKYKQINNTAPHVAACHAGLECGILEKRLENFL